MSNSKVRSDCSRYPVLISAISYFVKVTSPSSGGDFFRPLLLSIQLRDLCRNQVWPFNPRPTAPAHGRRLDVLIAHSLRPNAPPTICPIQSPMTGVDCVKAAVRFEPDPPNGPAPANGFDRLLRFSHCLTHFVLPSNSGDRPWTRQARGKIATVQAFTQTVGCPPVWCAPEPTAR